MAATELPRFMIEATKNLADKVAALHKRGLLVDVSAPQKQTLISEFHEEDNHAEWRRLNDGTRFVVYVNGVPTVVSKEEYLAAHDEHEEPDD